MKMKRKGMRKRRGMGKGKGMGYYNIAPMDSYVHAMSAKGVSMYAHAPDEVLSKFVTPQELAFLKGESERLERSDSALLFSFERAEEIMDEIEDAEFPSRTKVSLTSVNEIGGDIDIDIEVKQRMLAKNYMPTDANRFKKMVEERMEKLKKEGKVKSYKIWVFSEKDEEDYIETTNIELGVEYYV